MNLFQLSGLLLLTLLVIVILRSFRCGRLQLSGFLLWLGVLLLGMLALVFPNTTTTVAQFIGIRRGADLLFYTAILVGLFIAFIGYLRFRILDRQITLLVRHHALQNALTATENAESKTAKGSADAAGE
jgi:small membrane protein